MASLARSACLLLVAWTPLVLASACSDGSGPSAGEATVRDSAGVVIVEHPGERLDGPEWSVPRDGFRRLAGEFFQVRGAFVLSDGRIVVGNGGTREVRFYRPDGELERTVGREGEGPGEFRNMSVVSAWPGDSVFVFDVQARRATLFDRRGELGRTFSMETTEEAPFANVRGVHADGGVVATGFARMGEGPPSGRLRIPSPLYRFDQEGGFASVLPFESSSEGYYESLEGGFRVMTPLFPRATRIVAGPGVLLEAPNDSWEVRIREPSGELVRIVRRNLVPERVTDALRRRAVERQMDLWASGDAEAAQEFRRTLQAMPVPDRVPAYGMVTVDLRDRVWVAEWQPDPEPEEVDWLVFDRDGAFVARVRTPGRLTPLEIGPDYMLGVWRDELDVEQVVMADLQG